MAEPQQNDGKPDSVLQGYLDHIAQYEREFKKWEGRADKIIKRYRDEGREIRSNNEARFSILWSNVQTLIPATFSRLPQPDVSRRFRDNDPVGRVAALLCERALDFEVQHYSDYRYTMKQCVQDRFLGGRGTAWARYEPHFRAGEAMPDDGLQITEDADEAPVNEQLDYECAPVDYVHWKDFGHSIARTWEEVTIVWRKVYMSREAVEERFGEDMAKTIPYDATPEAEKRSQTAGANAAPKQALVYELWDKEKARVCWLSKSLKQVIDEKPDPLGLKNFFPCPKPLYATLTNDSLVPVPDFVIYQDQANSLDVLADRIDGLIKMLQLKGVYDASADAAIGRLFTEGTNGTLIAVKNWAAFAEKNGLQGQIDVYDLKPIYEALRVAIETAHSIKEHIYELTGISDIVRGQTMASETATAQQIKGQYASLRLKAMQDDVARFATELLQLKAQIICGKFAPATIATIAAAEQLSEVDKALVYPPPPPPAPGMPPMPAQGKPAPVGPAMALLVGPERLHNPDAESPNPLRAFRIEVAADTLVQIDEQTEKQDRMEMLGAFGKYLKESSEVAMANPALVPLLVEVGKFGLTAFKVGKSIEGTFDAALDQLREQAKQPRVDPEQMQEQALQAAKAQVAQENATKEIGLNKRAADLDIREMKFGVEQELAKIEEEAKRAQFDNERNNAEEELRRRDADVAHKAQLEEHHSKMRQDRASFDEERARFATETHEKVQSETQSRDEALRDLVKEVAKQNAETQMALAQLVKAMARPKRIVRGPDGRAAGVETVQ